MVVGACISQEGIGGRDTWSIEEYWKERRLLGKAKFN